MKNPIRIYDTLKLLWSKTIINSYHSQFIKHFSLLMILAILNLAYGCNNYFKVTKDPRPASESLPDMQNQEKNLILHFENSAWVFQNAEIKENAITGFAFKPYESVLPYAVNSNKPNKYNKNSPEQAALNEVHMYTAEYTRLDSFSVSVPFSGIQKVEIYNQDKNATAGSYFLGTVGITAGVAAFISIIVALTKSSCPFIYTFKGEQPILTGEIFSGSIQSAMERHDFLKIPNESINQELKLKIANEVKEIQHTNLMELWIFDHDKNTDVWIDKYGKCHFTKTLIPSSHAETLTGTNVTDLISFKDSLFYTSTQILGELPLTDGIIMEFPNPKSTDKAKLVVRAKNSFVLDYMMGQFQNQFGDLYGKWFKKQQKASEETLNQWKLDQNLPLSLSVERNGIWEPVDYYNIAGPIAFKEDILSIPLNGNESDPIKVKLEYGNFFWEIDYAGMDYTNDTELNYQIIKVNTAVNQNEKEVSKYLLYDDKQYYDQPEVGDFALVSFKLPEQNSDKRTVYLHSKGWYHVLRNPSGTPDREYLETFRQPGRFNQFVNEYIQTVAKK